MIAMKKNKLQRWPISFTLDKDVFEKFRQLCKKNDINRSRFIENFILDYIRKNREEGNE